MVKIFRELLVSGSQANDALVSFPQCSLYVFLISERRHRKCHFIFLKVTKTNIGAGGVRFFVCLFWVFGFGRSVEVFLFVVFGWLWGFVYQLSIVLLFLAPFNKSICLQCQAQTYIKMFLCYHEQSRTEQNNSGGTE